MPAPIALLTLSSSPLGESLLSHLGSRGRVLSLDAPFHGGAVTIREGWVSWGGLNLVDAGAILVERPEIAWPQPLYLDGLPEDPAAQPAFFAAEREVRSLILSALTAASEYRPVVNHPRAAHQAASPATALDLAAHAGVPVHPWRLAPRPPTDLASTMVLDSVGRDRWHDPASPREGEPALLLEELHGPVEVMLILGGRVAARLRHENPSGWAEDAFRAPAPAGPPDAPAADIARRAAAAAGLEFAAVSVAAASDGPRLLYLDAAPDLVAWSRADASVLPALAGRLLELASQPSEGTS